jgi:hypothetical protein
MTEIIKGLKDERLTSAEVKTVGELHPSNRNGATKINGTLTSPIQLREDKTKEPYYYSFIRLKGQKIDLPIIFKDNNWQEPLLKKGIELELTGNYSNSDKNVRKSFTAYTYQILNEKKLRKKCFGCGDKFACSPSENYDYCSKCELNGSRYIPGRFIKNDCPECGDGSGTVKFPNSPPRACQTCSFAKQAILAHARRQLPELEAQTEKIRQDSKVLSHD